jgi:hypothetical protein
MKRKITRKPKSARAKSGAKKKASRKPLAAVITSPPDAVDALVKASAQALAISLAPDWHAGVKFNLQLVLRHAAVVEAFPLADDAEPAPIFRA